MVVLDFPQPFSVYIYYSICSSNNRNNQIMRGRFNLEKNLGDHNWDRHVDMSIFGVSVVYTYNVSTQYISCEDTSH